MSNKPISNLRLWLSAILILLMGLTASAEGPTWSFKYKGRPYTVISEEDKTVKTGDLTDPDNILPYFPTDYEGGAVIPSVVSDGFDEYTVVSIGEKSFYECRITSVSIPNTVTTIEDDAFEDCWNLQLDSLPNSLSYIGRRAFRHCPLTSIFLHPTTRFIGWYAFDNDVKILCYKDTQFEESEEYLNTSLICRYDDNSIFENGFVYNHDRSELISVSHYEGELDIPSSINKIIHGAFAYCKGLTSINIPSSVTEIGSYAFFNCAGLTSITIPSTIEVIGKSTFSYCENLKNLSLPENLKELGPNAFYSCKSLEKIIIPENITEISDYLFWNCSSLQDVILPDAVTSIGESSFYNCAITSLDFLPSSVNCIKWAAFTETKLVDVVIPENIKILRGHAFSYCKNLKSIKILADITTIPYGLCEFCLNLEKVTISQQITEIEENAFTGYIDLKEMYCYPVEAPRGIGSISGRNITIHIPIGSLESYKTNWGEGRKQYIEDLDPSAIDTVEKDGGNEDSIDLEEPYEIFDMNGTRIYGKVDNLPPGLYILRQDSKTSKHLVK